MHICLTNFMGQRILLHIAGGGGGCRRGDAEARGGGRTGIKKKVPAEVSPWGPRGAATYSPAFAVPSARRGLTSLFGMGRGGTLALWPPLSFVPYGPRYGPPYVVAG